MLLLPILLWKRKKLQAWGGAYAVTPPHPRIAPSRNWGKLFPPVWGSSEMAMSFLGYLSMRTKGKSPGAVASLLQRAHEKRAYLFKPRLACASVNNGPVFHFPCLYHSL